MSKKIYAYGMDGLTDRYDAKKICVSNSIGLGYH